jgi:hypothetical protein
MFSAVRVYGGQGVAPSIYPMRSYPMNKVSN